MLTGASDETDRVVGLEIGGDDYMTKPVSPRELAARVKAILRRGRTLDQTAETVSEQNGATGHPAFLVDTDRFLITYHGTPLELSRYEYRLLCVLIDKPGWVFSREKLMTLVWDEPEASMDRTVDAHIKSIRAKLRAVVPDKDPIKTKRGLGYALEERS
jgi:two-component system catabolic regulation response regulator CreB